MSNEFGLKTTLVYKVETNFPNSSCPEKENKFSSYSVYSYTDVRNPSNNRVDWLINTQPTLFDKRTASPYGGHGETLSFANVEEAIAVAQFLQKYGRLTAGWDMKSQEKYQKQYRGPLKVRIVEVMSQVNRTLIEFESIPEVDQFEIELAALKKKHNRA